MSEEKKSETAAQAEPQVPQPAEQGKQAEEIGGPAGPEPTRFGDWEKAGRCSDF